MAAHLFLIVLFRFLSPPSPCLMLDVIQLHERHLAVPCRLSPAPTWIARGRPRRPSHRQEPVDFLDRAASDIDFIDREIRGARVMPAQDVDVRVRGELSRAYVGHVVHLYSSRVLACYQRALQKRPSLQGRVLVRFVIGETGSVEEAAVVASELKDASLDSCITGVIRRWHFRAPDDGRTARVTYPFELRRIDK